MTLARGKYCENCRHFDLSESECHHSPPVINKVTGQGMWPRVSTGDCCGQWRAEHEMPFDFGTDGLEHRQ